jgi:threonine synthase
VDCAFVGLGLLPFAADLFVNALRDRIDLGKVKIAIGGDVAWVLCSVAVVVVDPTGLTTAGFVIVGAKRRQQTGLDAEPSRRSQRGLPCRLPGFSQSRYSHLIIDNTDSPLALDICIECIDCKERTPATVRRLSCGACDGLLKLRYTHTAAADDKPSMRFDLPRTVSLGEGGTPLVSLAKTARRLGLGQLWAKLEFVSPTGSFKDRGSAVLISAALAEGVTEFTEDSSGNAGASLAAYAAAAGIKAHIFVPSNAAPGKLDQIRIFGADLHAIDGPRQAATDAAEAFLKDRGMPYLSHNLSPYFSDGMKAFAYEIEDSATADIRHVVLPVGNGSLLIGAKAGFDELIELGTLAETPRFHAVQAEAVQPLVAAVGGNVWSAADVRPTVASGIAVSSPPRLAQCVDVVRSSGGGAIAVPDDAAIEWQRRLARDEGIFCEVTSAVACAGLERLISDGVISPDEPVLVAITGSGLKEPVRG